MMSLSTYVLSSAELRDRLEWLDWIMEEDDRKLFNDLIDEYNYVRDSLNSLRYGDDMEIVVSVTDGKNHVLAEAALFEYADGVYGVQYGLSVGDSGVACPYETIGTRQEAIDYGVKRIRKSVKNILDWHGRNVPAKTAQEAKKVLAVLDETEKVKPLFVFEQLALF